MVSNCEFVTFPLVARVRCGTRLYRFLILLALYVSDQADQCFSIFQYKKLTREIMYGIDKW